MTKPVLVKSDVQAPAVPAVRRKRTIKDVTQPRHRPYLMDSSLVRADINRHLEAAMVEVDAVDADILSIETRANNDIQLIRQRAEKEIEARRHRKADLMEVVEMTSRALGVPVSPNMVLRQKVDDLQLEDHQP